MDNGTITHFIRWMENATNEQLDARRREMVEARSKVNLALRLLDEEYLTRMGFAAWHDGKKACAASAFHRP